jgi:hypothetical protein
MALLREQGEASTAGAVQRRALLVCSQNVPLARTVALGGRDGPLFLSFQAG